jgi:hypothetical protein
LKEDHARLLIESKNVEIEMHKLEQEKLEKTKELNH